MPPPASILIPAHNEAGYLPACIDALLASDPVAGAVEVVVIANGCNDDTVALARGLRVRVEARGWTMQVIDLPEGGKLNALNTGEAATGGAILIYIDADVQVSPPLIAEIVQALDVPEPRYASGQPQVTTSGGPVSRAYARFWRATPFMTVGVPGFGVFAMNRAGRRRWGDWPDIIADDTFARLHFTPAERIGVQAGYAWPMIDGFGPLVRVRRRQDRGVAEIAARFPQLLKNDDLRVGMVPLWRRVMRDPLGFAAYLSVRIAGLWPVSRNDNRWARGR